ncbi:MAG: hypothetical protein RR454_05015 [Clostridia bacterium]
MKKKLTKKAKEAINESLPRLVDKQNLAMSLKDENNDIKKAKK